MGGKSDDIAFPGNSGFKLQEHYNYCSGCCMWAVLCFKGIVETHINKLEKKIRLQLYKKICGHCMWQWWYNFPNLHVFKHSVCSIYSVKPTVLQLHFSSVPITR